MNRILILLATVVALVIQPPPKSASGEPLSARDEQHIQRVVREHMDKYSVPGLSIAIAKDGRLVFARGFGFADRENQVAVEPKHRFRIASISKPITSIAIHRLVEMGKLNLDERVFGEGAIFGIRYGEKRGYSPGVEQITVRHLLEHAHGGWDNKRGDPMFLFPKYSQRQLINWTLDNRPLDREPGEGYSYSNFGYCLLGRVIEERSGVKYEDFVKRHVTGPVGADSLALAGNTLAQRLPNEVVYYSQGDGNPYLMPVTRMDAHGGWIASAPDLVRIAASVDGFPTRPDILRPTSIRSMVQPSRAKVTYAKGWNVNSQRNYWHSGSIPGTRTIMARTHHGYCWALLSNTRSKKPGHASDLDQLAWRIVDGVQRWPNHDLFRQSR